MTDIFFVCVANDIKPLVIARSERSERRGNLFLIQRLIPPFVAPPIRERQSRVKVVLGKHDCKIQKQLAPQIHNEIIE